MLALKRGGAGPRAEGVVPSTVFVGVRGCRFKLQRISYSIVCSSNALPSLCVKLRAPNTNSSLVKSEKRNPRIMYNAPKLGPTVLLGRQYLM